MKGTVNAGNAGGTVIVRGERPLCDQAIDIRRRTTIPHDRRIVLIVHHNDEDSLHTAHLAKSGVAKQRAQAEAPAKCFHEATPRTEYS
jgi:hypothetical protein